MAYAVHRRNHQRIIRLRQEEALKQKEELNQMKFRFFTNISHDLRTPLTLIITLLDMMMRKMADETMKKQLGRIYKITQNMLSLVNQLPDFRKLEMKGEKLSLMSGDMGKFIVAFYDNFMPIAVEKHLNFDYRSMHKSLYVFFDCDKVRKIVNNLLSNAFKFTPESGSVTLSVSTEEKEGRMYVKIDVSDTGVGISKSDLPFIFDRFYQTGKQTDEKPGSGIGLHLVREYAAIHEGRIKVKSQTDRLRIDIYGMAADGLETGYEDGH